MQTNKKTRDGSGLALSRFFKKIENFELAVHGSCDVIGQLFLGNAITRTKMFLLAKLSESCKIL